MTCVFKRSTSVNKNDTVVILIGQIVNLLIYLRGAASIGILCNKKKKTKASFISIGLLY